MNKYINVTGTKSGKYKGGVTQKGREGSSFVLSFDMGVETPSDQHTGLAAGMRRHKPFLIRKEIDVASPLYLNSACTNEVLTKVTLQFYKVGHTKVGAAGTEVNYYTIELDNARVASYRSLTPEHAGDSDMQQKSTWDIEEIQFTYQKITTTITDGGITCTDDWEARN
jgi:type VI secretion system secreted protein Hcp